MDSKAAAYTETNVPHMAKHVDSMPDHQTQIEVPEVTWYKDPGLRKLYLMMPLLFLGATINGYDGSLLNGLQTMDPWQDCRSLMKEQ